MLPLAHLLSLSPLFYLLVAASLIFSTHERERERLAASVLRESWPARGGSRVVHDGEGNPYS
jgi:hypothetical protein